MRVRMTPIHRDEFFHDGRGPELQSVHWDYNGRLLRAIDYFNPTDPHESSALKHVLIVKPQIVMITPEEVINYGKDGQGMSVHKPAAMFDLGRTDWLRSFAPRHLGRCRHFQMFFYDELFDIVAEDIRCVAGGYESRAG